MIVGGAGRVMDREVGPGASDAVARLVVDLAQRGGAAALATEDTVAPGQKRKAAEEDGSSADEARLAVPDTPTDRGGAGEEGDQPEIGDAVPTARQVIALSRKPIVAFTIQGGGVDRINKLITPAAGGAARYPAIGLMIAEAGNERSGSTAEVTCSSPMARVCRRKDSPPSVRTSSDEASGSTSQYSGTPPRA